jgi:hypothetical protein
MKTKPSPTPYVLVAVGIPACVIGGPRDRANGFVCSKALTLRARVRSNNCRALGRGERAHREPVTARQPSRRARADALLAVGQLRGRMA